MKSLIRGLALKAGYEIRRVHDIALPNRDVIHFLHIGKNAGTQISNVADQVNAMSPNKLIVKHSHDVYLKHLPAGEDYFFSIRDPVSRFRSGFYSRKRKGQPRIYSEWSDYEEVAFRDFDHANDLAESLFKPGDLGKQAWAAMKSIRHNSQNQSDWFDCGGNFLEVRPPIWIIRQETFGEDLREFLNLADLGVVVEDISIANDKVKAHANNYAGIPHLSEKAKQNLRRWYAQDYIFYDLCKSWIQSRTQSLVKLSEPTGVTGNG